MKFSFRQILASTAGAVIAAVVASTFGVKGTIIGVAIGSAAATMGTAFVAQSIDRGHEAVKQVAVRVPETSTLLRKLGGTTASGPASASVDGSSAPGGAETVEVVTPSSSAGAETERVPIAASTGSPATERLRSPVTPLVTRAPSGTAARGFSWRAIAASAAIVFVLALLFITAVELISGKPLSAIFGGAGSGTSIGDLDNSPSPTTPTTPTSTTSTTAPSGSTTTTNAGGTTTSTTEPTGSASTTTSPSPVTTTTGPGAAVTTTTSSSSSP